MRRINFFKTIIIDLRRALLYGLVICKVDHFFRFLNRKKFLILLYHGLMVKDKTCPSPILISTEKFKSQVNYLLKYYNIIPLEVLMSKINNREKIPRYSAVITFDDGLESNYSIAYPFLSKNKVPATFFLTTNNIDTKNICWPIESFFSIIATKEKKIDLTDYGMPSFNLHTIPLKQKAATRILEYLRTIPVDKKNELIKNIKKKLDVLSISEEGWKNDFYPLTWEQVIHMNDSGLINFGSHGSSHEILTQLDNIAMKEEIRSSCDVIKKKLNLDKISFAYPHGKKGDFSADTKKILSDNKILCGLTTITGLNDYHGDKYELKRIGIGGGLSFNSFKLLISGFFWF